MTANIFKTGEGNTKRDIRRQTLNPKSHTKDSSLKFVSDVELGEAKSLILVQFFILKLFSILYIFASPLRFFSK